MTQKPVTSFNPSLKGPLSDIRVLDLSRLVAGNMLSLQLADFGADVIKIEPPTGDPLRAWKEQGLSLYWKVYGRNKRSVCMDLRHPPAMDALRKLIQSADVFIENFRPGTLEKMNLSPADMLTLNPDLIVVRVSGYGQTGPNAQLPGFGTLVEAMSGFADQTGFADREPVLPPLALADMIAGVYGSSAVSMALLARERGKAAGQIIDLSLLEPIFSMLGPEVAIHRITGKINTRLGSASKTASPRNVYLCNDGKYLALSGSIQAIAKRIFAVIGKPEMIEDPRFCNNSMRLTNREAVDAELGGWFARHTSADALKLMRDAGATVGPVYGTSDISKDPHFIEREVFLDVDDPELGPIAMHNIVPRLSETPGGFRYAAPALGAHTSEILAEIGLDDNAIKRITGANT